MSEFSKLSFWFLSKILKSTSLRRSMHTEQWDVTYSLTGHVGFAIFWNWERETAHLCSWANCHTLPGDFGPKTSLLHVQSQNHPQVLQYTNFQVENTCWNAWSLKIVSSDFPKLKLLKLLTLFETISFWLLGTPLNFNRGDWKRKMLSSVRQHAHLR